VKVAAACDQQSILDCKRQQLAIGATWIVGIVDLNPLQTGFSEVRQPTSQIEARPAFSISIVGERVGQYWEAAGASYHLHGVLR
jgi:hypothetical protein